MRAAYLLKISTFALLMLWAIFGRADSADAATNIHSTNKWAWIDAAQWVDFAATDNVNVFADRLEGYASSAFGEVALNCNSTPNGNVCTSTDFKVSNDGSGGLTGWAWNDFLGWISFDNISAGSPYSYQVTIDGATGDFSGWAWSDVGGWISFNCANPDICSTSSYKVNTSWRATTTDAEVVSSVYDTLRVKGAAYNSIMWQGSQPSNSKVRFQLATSDTSTGPWTYRGPDGTALTYYAPSGPDIPVAISRTYHNNHRYVRYKVFLQSNTLQTQSPRVDDIILNWSP